MSRWRPRPHESLVLAGVLGYAVAAPLWAAWLGDDLTPAAWRGYVFVASTGCLAGALALFRSWFVRVPSLVLSLALPFLGLWLLGPVLLVQLAHVAAALWPRGSRSLGHAAAQDRQGSQADND